jgi:hypothetical protein
VQVHPAKAPQAVIEAEAQLFRCHHSSMTIARSSSDFGNSGTAIAIELFDGFEKRTFPELDARQGDYDRERARA